MFIINLKIIIISCLDRTLTVMNNTNNDENQYNIGDSTQEFMSKYII